MTYRQTSPVTKKRDSKIFDFKAQKKTPTTTMTPTATALGAFQNQPPWVDRRFLKDAKLRVQERYWRLAAENSFHHSKDDLTAVIPDGVVWRRYLKLLLRLVDQESSLKWILLESAAELLDWRNSSPCIETNDGCIKEAAALQERNKLKKCVEEHGENVQTLCDLSIREEECDEWNVLDYPGMTVAERSRHALFRAGRFVMAASASQVLLLVNDKEEYHGNENEEMRVLSMDELLEFFGERYPEADMEELLTLKQVCEETYHRRNSPKDDEKSDNVELTEEQVQDGLRSGALVRGRLEVTKANPKEAYVSVGKSRYFVNMESDNYARALHHDVVIVKPLAESQWGRPVGRRRLIQIRAEEEEGADVDGEGPTVPSACIVAVVSSSRREFVATLVDEPAGDERAVLVVPFDIRIPKIRVQSRGWPTYVNQRLLVEIDGWEANSNYPSGHCVTIIGPIGSLETEVRGSLSASSGCCSCCF
jgi:hypothetical protein